MLSSQGMVQLFITNIILQQLWLAGIRLQKNGFTTVSHGLGRSSSPPWWMTIGQWWILWEGWSLPSDVYTLVGLPDSNRKYQDSGHTVLDKIKKSQNKAKICMWENFLVGGKWESGQNTFTYYELYNEQISMDYVKTEKWGLECNSVTQHSLGICAVCPWFYPQQWKKTLIIIIINKSLLLLNIHQVLGTVFSIIILILGTEKFFLFSQGWQ